MGERHTDASDGSLEEEFRGVARRFVEDAAPLSATRRFVDGGAGYDRRAWDRAVGELGAVQLAVPEELGGHGAGLPVTGVLFEEMGRALTPSPLLATVGLAASVLAALGTARSMAALQALGEGSGTATLGWVGASGSWDPADTPLRIRGEGDDLTVSGSLHHVVDGDSADILFLVVRREEADDGRPTVVAVRSEAPGVSARRVDSLDLTRPLARVDLDRAPAVAVGGADDTAAIRWGLLCATSLLVAESAGSARKALELSVSYAKDRRQFGRPIGSFQAIKHLCADMLARVELTSAVAHDALRALEEDGAAAAPAVHAAKAYASEAFFEVASQALQVHGGIGFTWEHDIHLFFRRAKASDLMFGGPVRHRAAVAAGKGWVA